MNILRTIPQDEKPEWVSLMFEVGPHADPDAPTYPLDFPLPFRLSKDLSNGFLYVVYRFEIIGYGKIQQVVPHEGHHVGSDDRPMKPGHNIILDGPLVRMPTVVQHRGFQGIQYDETNFHEAK